MDMADVPELIRRNWAWADHNSPCGPVPHWIERTGDLVVDGAVTWSTPDDTPFGEISYDLPPGTYPVFIGVDGSATDDPALTRYDVRMVFIALADPDRLAGATWQHDQGGLVTIDDYTCLSSHGAYQLVSEDTFARLKEEVLSTDGLHRRGHWPTEVVDPDSGLNMMLFPSDGSSGVSCVELVDGDDLVGLLHFSYGI